jgi:hypothetical protein
MNRALLVAIATLTPIAFPALARAADWQADPFAPSPPDAAPAEPDEDALLRGSARTSPPPPSPPPVVAPAPAAPPDRPVVHARSRRAAQASDESHASTGAAPVDELGGVALELSTSGFASGALAGGIFVGGRKGNGLILGGFFDYSLVSLTASPGGADITTSAQVFRLGAGARHTFVRSADRRVDLFGAADVSFEYQSAEVVATAGTGPTQSVGAAGFSLALGPGLRLWVHEQIAVGYAARFRLTYLAGDAGALTMTTAADASAAATSIEFDGTFQLLGVF